MPSKKILYTVLALIIAVAYGGKVLTPVGTVELGKQKASVSGSTPDVGAPLISGVDPIATSTKNETLYKVTKVVDGDTIKIEIGGKIETVRLIGADTPEVVDPRKPVQCFGREASAKTKEWLTGREVKIETDSTQGERDKYGRLLLYIYRDDGLFINKELIAQGYAHEYTYDIPYKFQKEFKVAEKSAREAGNGLWAKNACIRAIRPSP